MTAAVDREAADGQGRTAREHQAVRLRTADVVARPGLVVRGAAAARADGGDGRGRAFHGEETPLMPPLPSSRASRSSRERLSAQSTVTRCAPLVAVERIVASLKSAFPSGVSSASSTNTGDDAVASRSGQPKAQISTSAPGASACGLIRIVVVTEWRWSARAGAAAVTAATAAHAAVQRVSATMRMVTTSRYQEAHAPGRARIRCGPLLRHPGHSGRRWAGQGARRIRQG